MIPKACSINLRAVTISSRAEQALRTSIWRSRRSRRSARATSASGSIAEFFCTGGPFRKPSGYNGYNSESDGVPPDPLGARAHGTRKCRAVFHFDRAYRARIVGTVRKRSVRSASSSCTCSLVLGTHRGDGRHPQHEQASPYEKTHAPAAHRGYGKPSCAESSNARKASVP